MAVEVAEPCLSAHSLREGCCHNIKLKSNFLLNKEGEKIQSNDRKKINLKAQDSIR